MNGFYDGKTDTWVKDQYDGKTRSGGLQNDHGHIQQLPDARKHQIISFIKSGIRILGYALLPFNLVMSVIFLILSEVVGIIEELV
jgi:hypothetical protein